MVNDEVAHFYGRCRAFYAAVSTLDAELLRLGGAAAGIARNLRSSGPRGVKEIARAQAASPFAGSPEVQAAAEIACAASVALQLIPGEPGAEQVHTHGCECKTEQITDRGQRERLRE